MVYWHHHLEMHLKNDWVEWYAQRCCEPLHAHNNLPKIFICHQNCDRRANCIHGNIGSRIIHYCRPGIFRALLFFAIFAIWTPFAKNTRSRNIQFRRSSNYFQNRVLTGTSACTSTGNRSIHRPHKFSLILSTTRCACTVHMAADTVLLLGRLNWIRTTRAGLLDLFTETRNFRFWQIFVFTAFCPFAKSTRSRKFSLAIREQ